MGNFKHHITGAVAVGAVCSAGSYYYAHASIEDSAAALLLCVFGGILPDIDCPVSKPSDIITKVTSVLLPVFLLQSISNIYLTPSKILLIAVASYLLAMFGVKELIRRFTTHRGIIHSIPSALIWGGVVFLAFKHSPHKTQIIAGISAILGFLTHLIIDEIFSLVNISGGKFTPKPSSGSAMKLFSNSFFANILTYAILTIILYFCASQYGLIH